MAVPGFCLVALGKVRTISVASCTFKNEVVIFNPVLFELKMMMEKLAVRSISVVVYFS